MLENRKLTLKITKSVMKSFTVITFCTYMCLMFILPPTPKLSKSVTKNFHSVTRVSRTVCRDKWSMFMNSVKMMQKQNYARKVLHPCQCQLRIKNLTCEKCDKDFSYKDSLKYHKATHSGERLPNVTFVTSNFAYLSNMKKTQTYPFRI